MATSTYVCVKDYERQALSLLDRQTGDFFYGGADDEQTLSDNTADFKRQYCVLHDVGLHKKTLL